MGRMELYIYICTWNGLIVIQDLCNYYMNCNVRRNFTMGLNICYISIYHLSVYLAFNIIIYLLIYLLIYTSFIALKLWLHNGILSQFKSKVDLRHTMNSVPLYLSIFIRVYLPIRMYNYLTILLNLTLSVPAKTKLFQTNFRFIKPSSGHSKTLQNKSLK